MTFSLNRLVARLGLAAAFAASLVITAGAQGTVRGEYGDWQMSCDTPPGASFEQCAVIQDRKSVV